MSKTPEQLAAEEAAELKKKLEDLKSQRASTKGNMTRIKNQLVANIETISKVELDCRVNIFEQYWKLWMAHQTSIEKLKPNEATNEIARSEAEDLYCEVKVLYSTRNPDFRNQTAADLNSTASHNASSNNRSSLPQLKLPNFSGKYADYANFISIFNKLVGDDENLNTTEKYNHLRYCLSGSALRTIDSLGKSSENYTAALLLLKQRYDNKCLIFQEHLHEIMEISKVTKNSAPQLRHLLDKVSSHLNSMRTIGTDSDIMNSLIIQIISSKLDPDSLARYEESLDYSRLQKWSDMHSVLTKRCQLLEVREGKQQSSQVQQTSHSKKKFNQVQTSFTASSAATSCLVCKENHRIEKCSKFNQLSVFDRYHKAKQLQLCINCLRSGHTVKQCKSSKCKVCSQNHHTLLHRYEVKTNASNKEVQPTSNISQFNSNLNQTECLEHQSSLPSTSSFVSNSDLVSSQIAAERVMLATVVVQIKDASGSYRLARALLDSGSQLNFVTDQMVNSLQLKRRSITASVSGIGQKATAVKSETFVNIKSCTSNFEVNINCWILPSITKSHPENNINLKNFNIPANISLADPHFHKSQKIDLLIGAEKFYELMSVGQIRLNNGGPILQKTVFGWIVSGSYKPSNLEDQTCISATTHYEQDEFEDNKLSELVESFWKIEQIANSSPKLNQDHQNCEELFEKTTVLGEDNRLMVKLPFKKPTELLGESYTKARSRFLWLEKRLYKNPDIKTQYTDFLHEYLRLGHMEEIQHSEICRNHYFIPHQFVLRPESTSTKLRVVFNASSTTSTNISLNDILSVGPTVQNDIFAILLKFRCFTYALTADVSKMYRQIWVYPDDREFQLILWRDDAGKPLKIFRLKTLTYGTASAPYLATRSLNFLADKYSELYPKATEIIKTCVYVDDLLMGGDDIEEVLQLKTQVNQILQSANLELKKWYSNEPTLLEHINLDDINKTIRINDIEVIRALGMVWKPDCDEFRFFYDENKNIKGSSITKRSVLSDLARLYDPLGLLSPIVVMSKLFMQELWLSDLSWDEPLQLNHQNLHDQWSNFKQSLKGVNSIRIPRCVLAVHSMSTEIHGFSDASNLAYGACIYVKTIGENQTPHVHLLSSKSRVAPTKKKRTLPVLELLGAELLADLWEKIKAHYPKEISKIYFWTDSTIVLGWLSSHASRWQTLVANRVSKIQDITVGIKWKHVNSKSNPADIISRGCSVSNISSSIWFKGPEFLYKSEEFWPKQNIKIPSDTLPERRKTPTPILSFVGSRPDKIISLINNISSFTKIRRIFAYVHRFTNNIRLKSSKQPLHLQHLTAAELEAGFLKVVYLIQQNEFSDDIASISHRKPIASTSSLKGLNPFIDEVDNLLRVGGRLRNSSLPYTTKCPILLPKDNNFVKSYILYLHIKNCHAGSQALMSILQQQFWIIGCRDYTRRIVRKCVHCFKYRPKLMSQIMGDLPSDRVNANLAFSISGVDFAGPIYTSPSTRGHKMYKTYIAVFICFVSKGVHLEVVSDLTSYAFIAALKRFVSRRMLCKKLYCDNATNFVGAKRHLAELRQQFLQQSTQTHIANWCAENSIEFKHIPPRSPHFGSIWESAVKSAKSLLYPTLQNSKITFEQLTTVCCQIEAVLNSRPLTQLSTDPNDERALTPAHFWCQTPLDTIIEPDYTSMNLEQLSKWQRISAIQQHFWRRWSAEYITSLQRRTKWQDQSPNAVVDRVVLVHEDNLPPQKWLLGRIVSTVAGNDNKVRVAEVKTRLGTITRVIHKLALLPVDN